MIIYEGPSQINGAPIVAIVTGIKTPSKNRKTGPMAQLWILARDVSPVDEVKSGEDAAACGSCPLRGLLCYVNTGQAPGAIWRAYQSGSYDQTDPADVLPSKRVRRIRLGAYGDPAAVPRPILDSLIQGWDGHTGYTHQWQLRPDLMDLLMASTETAAQSRTAQADGWRTFSTDSRSPNSIECPADSYGVSCAKCGLCDGTRSGSVASIYITPHGPGASKF